MIALALLLASQISAAAVHVEVAFLPDDALAPALVIAVENTGARRALAWALVPPATGTSHSGSLADQAGARGLLALPQAPRGSGLVERDGALSITVDDAGAWEDTWQALTPSKAAALPVSGPRAFRLVVHGGVDTGSVPAVLYGNKVRITGTAVARAGRSEVRAIVTTGGKAAQFLDAPATAVDRVTGCGGEVPSAASVVTTSLALKLFAKGAPVCAGDLAVVPVEGTKLEAKKDLAVRGVLVRRR